MRTSRLAAICFTVLGLAPAAQAAQPVQGTAPLGLHGFLLRADEPVASSFPRTPSFAWQPVAGAIRYQFQLSTSSSFRESGIVYSATGLTTPVAAPSLTLPWITGNPYALFARVRAIKRSSSTPWSASFGFDMEPSSAPTPLPSAPGLLRWTPVEGADAYQVWFVDINNPTPKMEIVYTNVVDEREFYTFHRSPSWIETVRWRIRALRADSGGKRQNGLPAVGYGPWSPVYSSTNPAFTTGQIRLISTVSDVVSTGDASESHRLMPGFAFTGDQDINGKSAELFRVYVFTDRQCLNRVYTSAVFGGPAYAPRPFGPLALPTVPSSIIYSRGAYLRDGAEPDGYSYDGQQVKTTESETAATPTTAVPADTDSNDGSVASPPAGPQQLTITGNLGAPVDLWDTEWPSSGYYWTVIPVEAVSPGALETSTVTSTSIGDKSVGVANGVGYSNGDVVSIGFPSNQETATVTSASASALTFSQNLTKGHGVGEPIKRTGGNLQYQDLELPQFVCGDPWYRVARFGKSSEPSLAAAGELFASGLSPKGRLTAGTTSQAFYGSPLVAWTPALGASAYEVQWSKKRYPFKPQPNPQNQNALGTMTLGTSTVLPLSPGTWYYRVRGFNYTLPTGAQQMSWSDPARIVVAKPKFRVVGGGK
jgi:hypothetical protein